MNRVALASQLRNVRQSTVLLQTVVSDHQIQSKCRALTFSINQPTEREIFCVMLFIGLAGTSPQVPIRIHTLPIRIRNHTKFSTCPDPPRSSR